jgi:branched-chain amino acid transport system ATP-binding protein
MSAQSINGTAPHTADTPTPVPVPTPAAATTPSGAVLELRGVTAGYGRTTVLRNVDVTVAPGSVTALLGPNGAGKTTLLRTATGLVSPSSGAIHVAGEDHTKSRPFQRSKAGLCLVPEGRGIFPNLSVAENLRLQVPPWRTGIGYEPALEAFPVLKERLKQAAGSMSGGQQQMLALCRPFLSDPKVVLLDEVSMGLAPRIIDEIFTALVKLSESGVALLLVEQYVNRALKVADHVYLLGRGTIGYSGPPDTLDEAELVKQYVGA